LFSRYKEVFDSYPNLWLTGGAARSPFVSWAKQKLFRTRTTPEPPRDFDVVIIGGTLKDKALIKNLLRGHVDPQGVSIEKSVSSYLSSRDVGVNEVLLRPETLIFSTRAFRDIQHNQLNPAATAYDPDYQDIPYRIGLRALLFSLREKLPLSPMIQDSVASAKGFSLILMLSKAFETGLEDPFFRALQRLKNPTAMAYDNPLEMIWGLQEDHPDFKLTGNRIQKKLIQEGLIPDPREQYEYLLGNRKRWKN